MINTFNKIILSLGGVLLGYGFICRLVPINFFWESKTVGYIILLFGLIRVLASNKKKAGSKNIWNYLGIAFISLFLIIQTILTIIIYSSSFYKTAKNSIENSKVIYQEIGTIKGITLIPGGNIKTKTDEYGKSGSANIHLIVKGDKKYKVLNITLNLNQNEDWVVESME